MPDPAITLGYVREMGRVLRPAGWSAFQVSNDAGAHLPPGGVRLRRRLAALAGRAPRGYDDPAWLGSAIDLDALRSTASAAGLAVERVEAPGTFFCTVLVRRTSASTPVTDRKSSQAHHDQHERGQRRSVPVGAVQRDDAGVEKKR
jgi:hypothetical protein